MKILHFLWGLPNGGAENLAIDLANEQSRDHEVTLLVANENVDELVVSRIGPAVRYVCLGRPEGSRNPIWVVRLLLAFHRLRPDVIHSHADNLSRLGKFISAPIILTVHDTKIELSPTSTRFSMICCISESVLLDIQQRYPSLAVCLVSNGVMIEKIATGMRKDSKQLRGVQVSRLVHQKKGQDLLIKALALVNSDPSQPKLMVDFIGDGPSFNYLIKLAADVGATDYCKFLGSMPREEVYQNLQGYDLLIQPSRYEGFGLTVAEAMAAGVGVVVSDIEGPMEIIGRGKFGYFFKANDAVSLAGMLQKAMYKLNTPDGALLLDSARKHVTEKYSLSRTSQHYSKIYSEAINA